MSILRNGWKKSRSNKHLVVSKFWLMINFHKFGIFVNSRVERFIQKFFSKMKVLQIELVHWSNSECLNLSEFGNLFLALNEKLRCQFTNEIAILLLRCILGYSFFLSLLNFIAWLILKGFYGKLAYHSTVGNFSKNAKIKTFESFYIVF